MPSYISRRARHGFTLIEILIVVVILGILAAIVIPQFTDAAAEASRSNLQSQLQTLRSQLDRPSRLRGTYCQMLRRNDI